jgi:hypothetical protein
MNGAKIEYSKLVFERASVIQGYQMVELEGLIPNFFHICILVGILLGEFSPIRFAAGLTSLNASHTPRLIASLTSSLLPFVSLAFL